MRDAETTRAWHWYTYVCSTRASHVSNWGLIMSQEMRRYLDNAATSWPKPESVYVACAQTAREIGVAAGRGGYREAIQGNQMIKQARSLVAELVGGADASCVAFASSGTLALNMALHGFLKPGDHVIATAADHNATLRPLHSLFSQGVIELDIVPCNDAGDVDYQAISSMWKPSTRLLTCSHASNVSGSLQDAQAMAKIAHANGGVFLLDAAQTFGHLRHEDFACIDADIVIAPAHKWLLGPLGVGFLYVRPEIDIRPLVQGGTGSQSDTLDMPDKFPDRLEAGTLDLPAIAGMVAAIEWLESQPLSRVARHCRDLAHNCAQRLADISGIRVISAAMADSSEHYAPIVSFVIDGFDANDAAVVLEQVAGVQVRSGFHCAAKIHEFLGTLASGTVRASFGPFNTVDDVDAVIQVVKQLVVG